MRVRLVVLTAGKWRGKNILVKRLPFLIGRDSACHLRPTSALVSNRHCVLLARGGKVYVRDLGSTNGTLLNGEKITDERELHTNDGLRVGSVDFDVVIESGPSVGQPTPLPPAKGQLSPTNEEDVAALLLSIEDEIRPPASIGAVDKEGVPTGRTALDMPSPKETPATNPKTAELPSAPPPKGDTSTAASGHQGKSLSYWLMMLKDRNAEVRREAASALAAIGPPAVSGLLAMLQEGHSADRYWAVRTLGQVGPAAKAAVPGILAALKDEHREVRRETEEALMKIDPEAAHRAMGFWHRIRRLVKLRPFTRRGRAE
jgi:hypothetical protein